MFTRPADLRDDEVVVALADGWGLEVTDIEHAPVGFGSHHWWVRAGGRVWFATADDLRTRRQHHGEPLTAALERLRAALATATCLHRSGLAWVVAPVPAASGEVVVPLAEVYALALYPRVEGRTFGWGPFADDDHRAAVLDRLVDLHTHPGCRGLARVDDLTVPRAADLRATALDPGEERWAAGPFAGEAWSLLVERGAVVTDLLDRHARLVAGVDPSRFVVTHGEPHRANTVVGDAGVLLVDWDTVLLAPPERDLWGMVGEDPGVAGAYEESTGTSLDSGLLESYRLAWDLADLASFVPVLRAPHVDDEDTRTALAGLRGVLQSPQPDG